MRKFNLRSVDAAAVALQQAAAAWAERGLAVRYRAPAADDAPDVHAHYIAFRAVHAHGAWDGLIRADAWLAGVAPALAALASQHAGADRTAQLFAATPRPISPFASIANDAQLAPVFACTGIQACDTVDGSRLQNLPLAAVEAPEGTVWMRSLPPLPPSLPPAAAAPLPAWLSAAPASLQFLLGSSRLSRGCLSRTAPGDVLLVSEHALRMRCGGLMLGLYSINEEGIKVDELLLEPYEEDADAAVQAAAEHAGPADAGLTPAGLARVPVRLEFVLQQNATTVGALQQLRQGQVFGLDPLAEKEVLVLANGVALGRGELVQLEDRLGVEIVDIYGSGDHAH